MQLFLPFLLLFLLSNPIHGHKATKMVIVQRRGLAVKAAAPAPAASNATTAPAPTASDTTPPPKVDLIALMSKKGCKNFASLLSAGAGGVASTFEDAVSGGLTVFCPTDDAMKAFMPKFKNLTADAKVSLLLYHGVPEYNNLDFLKTNNGVVNTLATDGTARDYNFTVQDRGSAVTLETHVTTAGIKSTILDKDPLAIYSIDTVLEPRELFKPPAAAPAPAPSPALAPAADAPAAGKKRKGKKKHAAPAPAGPDAAPADQKAADENGVGRGCVQRWAATAAAMAVVMVVVV